MNFDLFRTIASIIGYPVMTRDASGNLTLDDGKVKSGLGKGAPVAITGDRELTNADDGAVLANKTANNYTLTVPVDLRAGFSCTIIQGSSGTVTLAAGAGAAVANASSYVKTAGAGAQLTLAPWDTDKYSLSGDGAVA